MIRLLLIRHATTEAVGRRLSGRKPGVHLNENGKAQTTQLVKRLAGLPIAAVYSSPLERAVETAIPIAKELSLEPVISADFLEIDFGNWTDCSIEELRSDKNFQRFNSYRSSTRIPGGETMLEAQQRIVSAFEKLHIQHLNQTVAVVSHSDLIKSAVAYYAGIHLDMFHRLEISPASVTILELFDETARLVLLNDTGTIV